MARRYITTAIDYPNAPPHMGHVMEKVLADVIARWWRLSGHEVRFQIGTDEHGVKIQRTAEAAGLTPQQLVDRNVPLFRELYERLQISSDDFIRTSDRARHWPTVEELWKRLAKAGVLQKRKYTGLYCSGCEKFLTKKDLLDGQCPNHQVAPEEVKEENYFFLLSREMAWLKDLLTRSKGGYRIIPEFRANETLSLLDQGLDDVSFSRPKSSLAWGVPVPGDGDQVMYVWCDALTNYVSTLDIFRLANGTSPFDSAPFDSAQGDMGELFWNQAEVTHVIGKDIARFHALIWPAMLKHAGLKVPPPHQLLIHGFLTSESQKMSKSLGNVVEPGEVIAKFGVDPLRFYLSHEIPVGNDGDFSWNRMRELYDAILRNGLGNLLNRVLVLLSKDGGTLAGYEKPEFDQSDKMRRRWETYVERMDLFELQGAVEVALEVVRYGNVCMDNMKPWTASAERRCEQLSFLCELLRHITLMLLPFIPGTAQEVSRQLGLPYAEEMLGKNFVITKEMREWGSQKDWKSVGEPSILFKPL